MSRRKIMAVVAVLLVILLPRTACANVIGPMLVPGLAQLWGLVVIPATALAALCESPFVRRAGVQPQPLFHAFNANLTSTMVGFLLVPIALPAAYTIGLLWIPIGVALSIWIEGIYYQKSRTISPGGLRWSWLIWGNAASAVLLVAVSVVANAMETPFRAQCVRPYWWPLMLLTIVGTTVGFLLGLRRAVKSARHEAPGCQPPASQIEEAQKCEIEPLAAASSAASGEDSKTFAPPG